MPTSRRRSPTRRATGRRLPDAGHAGGDAVARVERERRARRLDPGAEDLARGAPAQDAKPASAPAALLQDLDRERRAEGAAHAAGLRHRRYARAAPPRRPRVRRQVAAVRVVVPPGREEDEEALADDDAAPVDLEM